MVRQGGVGWVWERGMGRGWERGEGGDTGVITNSKHRLTTSFLHPTTAIVDYAIGL